MVQRCSLASSESKAETLSQHDNTTVY